MTLAAMSAVAPQVFSFSGRVGQSDTITRGFALAETHDQVIASFAAWGLRVTAVTALSELKAAVAAMEEIAAEQPAVGSSDFANLFATAPAAYAAANVFMLQGHYALGEAAMGGFAVAPDSAQLVEGLRNAGFEVKAFLSLSDARATICEMQSLEPGDAALIDLMELAEA
ncbi:hypothetical protein [Xanthomonas euvesicatoria]|uniref:hypothetical protein n=1 Tax=Xanthomonas euvesicatoria TaxID=456327 RepID=UPI001112B74D|nr:hypothetical protein [Xanthomonas euvesicatoria]